MSRRVASPSWPATLGEPGDSRPSRTRRTSERAAYCWPSQRRAATSRSVMPASVSQRGRRDDPPPGRPPPRPGAGAVDVGAGPGAASPKEALLGHGGTSEWDGRCRDARDAPARDGGELRRPGVRRAVLEQAQQRRPGDEHPAADAAHRQLAPVRGLVGQRPGDAEPPSGFVQRVGQPLLSRACASAGVGAGRVRSCCTWDLRSWCLAPGCSRHRRGHCLPSPACLTSSTRLRLACEDSRGLEPSQRAPPDVGTTGRDVSGRPGLD